MRFRNLSKIEIPKKLWINLAAAMKLDKALPLSIEAGAVPNTLLVTLKETKMSQMSRYIRNIKNYEKQIEEGKIKVDEIVGPCYSVMEGIGLQIYTCNFPHRETLIAYLTKLYLNDLFVEWFSEYHFNLFMKWNIDDLSDEFANISYSLIGGENYCGNYKMSVSGAMNKLPKFENFVNPLVRSKTSSMRKYKIKKYFEEQIQLINTTSQD